MYVYIFFRLYIYICYCTAVHFLKRESSPLLRARPSPSSSRPFGRRRGFLFAPRSGFFCPRRFISMYTLRIHTGTRTCIEDTRRRADKPVFFRVVKVSKGKYVIRHVYTLLRYKGIAECPSQTFARARRVSQYVPARFLTAVFIYLFHVVIIIIISYLVSPLRSLAVAFAANDRKRIRYVEIPVFPAPV